MASCDFCSSTILFGGVKDQGFTFCNDKCYQKGTLLMVASQVPEDVVQDYLHKVHRGACPQCKGNNGPVDVHTSHMVWSALILTSWSSTPQVSCRPCGRKNQAINMVASGILGWWGFPWGLIMTPVQVTRNFAALVTQGPDPTRPSAELEKFVRIQLAAAMVEHHQEQGATAPR